MRSIIFICLLTCLFGCSASKHAASHKAAVTLDGTWIPVTEEINGKPLPAASLVRQRLVIDDSLYTMTAESVDKGIVRYAEGKMDIYGNAGVNKGRHIPAIYKLEGEQLTICYNLKGGEYPATFETKGKQLYFLAVFKKYTEVPGSYSPYNPQSFPDR